MIQQKTYPYLTCVESCTLSLEIEKKENEKREKKKKELSLSHFHKLFPIYLSTEDILTPKTSKIRDHERSL